jgi:hypothetical protein
LTGVTASERIVVMRRHLLAAALAATLVLAAVPMAHAHGGTRAFSLVVAPDPVPAGAQTTFTATLRNLSTHDKLGSAEIAIPNALTGVSVADPPGYATATLSGGVVKVRDAKLAPGASLAIAITARTPCSGGPLAWSASAKTETQGSPLTLDTAKSHLTTTVTGACALRFVAGHSPVDARVGQTITASAYDPTGPVVQVEVVDGGGSRVTSSTVSITVALGPHIGSGTLSGTTTVAAGGGVASFANLSINAPGTYSLTATSPGLTSATSGSFHIDQVAVRCLEDVTCTATIANGQTTFDVTAPANAAADAGFLALSNNAGPTFDCDNYKELTASPTTIVGPDRTKTVTATIDRHALSAQHRSVSSVQMCFGAPYPFTPRPGATLRSLDTNGDDAPDFYFALLPDCGTAPCVAKRKQNDDCDAIIVVKAPGGPLDPAYRP